MSNHKYPTRFYDDPGAKDVMCNHCAHRTGITCKAFPDGIPREILVRGEHDTPFPGDHGYRFLKKEE